MPAKPSVNKCDEHNSMVNRHIGTAYDNVRIVAEHIEEVIIVSEGIEPISLYLGAFSTPPTEGWNNEPLKSGNFYLNTTENTLDYYDADEMIWISVDEETVVQAAQAAVAARDAAILAQTAAELAETNAESSAAAALLSEQNAALAEANSQASANASASSASDSATSAAEALASENAAKASETASAQSESNAATSETNAANSASAAATSESNAGASETAAANSAVVAAGYAADAEAAFDNFNDQYLGAKATDPTTDNDGNPLQVGATYWNTTTNDLRFWNGAAWDVPEQTAIQAANDAVAARDDAQVSEINAAASEAAAAQSETNAAQSAADALASENAAAGSETNAANSASSAATSATNAANSATSASTSETNAATSASNAATSETNAATSESNAAASASAASTSETNAATSASNAATSETNAENSKDAAELAEQNSLNNATAASNSASAAATSESNASASETNAATSASNAATSESNAAQSAADAQQSADDAAAIVPSLQSQIDNRTTYGEVGLLPGNPNYKAAGRIAGVSGAVDWDTLDEAGVYFTLAAKGSTNGPATNSPYYYAHVYKYASVAENLTQIAIPYGVATNQSHMAYRSRFNGVWHPWAILYSTDHPPTPAEIGAYTTAQVDAIETGLQNQINTLDGEVVKTSGDQTVSGVKTFSQDIIATSIRSVLGVDQGLLLFSGGSTRLGGTGSAAGIQLRPNGRDVASDTDYFSFQPNGTVEYEGASNFSVSRAGGQHGVFAYADGRTFLTASDGNIELRPKGLSDASKGLSMSPTGTTIHSHSGGAFLSFRDAVNDGTNSSSYMQWMHLDNTRRGFLGYGSSANNNMTWFNDEGANNIALKDNGEIDVNTGSVDRINLSGRVYGDRFLSDSATGGSWGHSAAAAVTLDGTNSGLAYNLVKVGSDGAKIQALGEGGNSMRLYPEGGSTSYFNFSPDGMLMPADSIIRFQGNYPNTSDQAPIFFDFDNPNDGSTSQIMRSMRETSTAAWVWERLNSATIQYSTGTNGNGASQITLDVTNARVGQNGAPTSTFHLTRKDYVDGVASDERLKSNIKTVEDALSIVNQIPVKTYLKEVQEWDEETQEDKVVHKFEYGFIAQEVEEVLPHLVTEREQDGMKEILRTGNDLHALAFGSIQQLKAENDELKAKNQELEERLAAIEAKLGL